MGRGNWFPGNSLEDCEVVYVELPVSDDNDSELDSWYWQDFRAFLVSCLPKSWDTDIRDWRETNDRFDSVGRDDTLIAFNGLFGLFVDSQGDNSHVGIGMRCRSDAPTFAKSRLRETAQRLFDRLQEQHSLSVRTSAWTSSQRTAGGWKQ